jgi:hypothetical protein
MWAKRRQHLIIQLLKLANRVPLHEAVSDMSQLPNNADVSRSQRSSQPDGDNRFC